jgi:molecular chaperone GrpE
MLYFRVLRIFERFGLVQLRTIGQAVNLDIHDVVEYRFSAHHEPDTIIAERQRGYVLDNKLLRDAKVVVARSPRS